MKIICKTLFDCSATGITGHFKPSQIPFNDRTGAVIDDQKTWNHSRNQQRNWETILQIISLRTQPDIIKYPYKNEKLWQFEFETASEGVYSADGTDLGALLQDCVGVPMIVNLSETGSISSVLCVDGSEQNIWFETINS